MIAVVDNYDSFTYNLVQYLGELDGYPKVFRNDEISPQALWSLNPRAIGISPGPGTPQLNGGISNELIRLCSGHVPILGVCLGQQCIGHVFGGQVVRAPVPMHGKASLVHHDGTGIFAGINNPVQCTRYHSLIVSEPLPDCLVATAHSDDAELMGLRHKTHLTFGVQFHPESILTEQGRQMLANFINLI